MIFAQPDFSRRTFVWNDCYASLMTIHILHFYSQRKGWQAVNGKRYQKQPAEYKLTYQLTIFSKFYPKSHCKTEQQNKSQYGGSVWRVN